jgi:hypothetical protein
MSLSSAVGVEIGPFLVAQEAKSERWSRSDFANPLVGRDAIVVAQPSVIDGPLGLGLKGPHPQSLVRKITP